MSRSLFSTVTSQIPFVNSVDGNRVQMASSMIRQSQLLLKPEPPLIVTDHSPIKVNCLSIQLAKENGQVIDKFNDIILVRYDSGEEAVFFAGDFYTTDLRIGDRFEKGDIIVHHRAYNKDLNLVMFGINANVMFAPMRSKTYEDAVVLTESGRDRFAYYYPVKYVFEFYNDSVELNPVLRLGSYIQKGDWILRRRKITSSIASYAATQTETEYSKFKFKVTKIKTVYEKDFLDIQPEATREFFKTYTYQTLDLHPLIKKALAKGFSYDGKAYLVIEGIAEALPVPGDKFANPYGNKGVVSFIVKDFTLTDEKTGISFTPDIIHTPVGIPSRMNVGQVAHMALGYVLKYVVPFRLRQISSLTDKIKFLLKVYAIVEPTYAQQLAQKIKQTDPKVLQRIVEDIEANGYRIVVPQFTYNIFKRIYKLYKELGLEDTFVCSTNGYRYGAGVIYTMLLEHLVIKKLKVRSVGPVDSKTLQPTDGQRMGEMEMWTLASHNALNFLKESLTIRSDDVKSKTKVIGNLIRAGISNMPETTQSPTFDLLRAYLSHMGIEIIDTTSGEG